MLSNHEFLSPIKCFFPVRPKIQKKTCWSGQQKKAIKLIFTFYFRSIELPIESASRLFPLPFTFSSSRALLPPRHSPCMLQCYTKIFMRSHEQVSRAREQRTVIKNSCCVREKKLTVARVKFKLSPINSHSGCVNFPKSVSTMRQIQIEILTVCKNSIFSHTLYVILLRFAAVPLDLRAARRKKLSTES